MVEAVVTITLNPSFKRGGDETAGNGYVIRLISEPHACICWFVYLQ
jgi:hypothetical protein